MEAAARYGRICRLLSPGAKHKAIQIVPRFVGRLSDPRGLHAAAVDVLRPSFRSASAQELDVLAFYLIARVGVALSGVRPRSGVSFAPTGGGKAVGWNLDPSKEASEITSLRLQMAMDRRSKFMETLSNILKKISTTSDNIVRNLK